MTESLDKVSKRFETPIMDSLREMQRNFVLAYCQCFDIEMAYKDAGYRNQDPQGRKRQIDTLIKNPKIVAAIDEYCERRLEQLDSGRAALCARLLSQALASVYDVCDRVEYRNAATGEVIPDRWCMMPKAIEDIEPRYHAAASLITRRPDGSYGWDNVSQHRAASLLAKLMTWDQEVLDTSAPMIFNFGAVQEQPYKEPQRDDSADMSSFDQLDDVDKLTSH